SYLFTTDTEKKFFANLYLTFHSWSPLLKNSVIILSMFGFFIKVGYSIVLNILPSHAPSINPNAVPDAFSAYLSDNIFHTSTDCSLVNGLPSSNSFKSSKYLPPGVISKV